MSNNRQDDEQAADGTSAGPPGATAPETPTQDRGRGTRFRAGLLEKLPRLGFSSWSAREDFKVDEEWAGIVSMRSDVVLGPLEPLAPERRGG
jgi:hypothetical protein